MVMVHAAATWNPHNAAQSTWIAYLVAGLGGLAAPLFVTIFGWGLVRSKSTTNGNIIKATILLLLQLLVNLFSPHLFEPLTPGILSLFALLILIKPLIVNMANNNISFLVFSISMFLIYGLSSFIYNIQGTSDWESRVSTNNLTILVSHLFLTGTYPLFPWITFAVVGAFLGSSITEGGKTLPRNNTTLLLIIIGMSYCLVSLILANEEGSIWAHPTKGAYLNFFPANIGFMIGSMTGVLIFWLIIQELQVSLFEYCGRLSLTIYVLHFIPLTLFSNIENERYWSVMEASLAVVIYTTAWLLFAFVWNRLQWLTIEALVRKLSSG
jgi:uncharacterized membrane protein